MKKSDVKAYNNVSIQTDIDFLLYQIDKRQVTLNPNTGLQKLIDECKAYIDLKPGDEVYNTTLKPVLVLYSLSDMLRMLWLKGKDFKIQLSAMNTGDFQ